MLEVLGQLHFFRDILLCFGWFAIIAIIWGRFLKENDAYSVYVAILVVLCTVLVFAKDAYDIAYAVGACHYVL